MERHFPTFQGANGHLPHWLRACKYPFQRGQVRLEINKAFDEIAPKWSKLSREAQIRAHRCYMAAIATEISHYVFSLKVFDLRDLCESLASSNDPAWETLHTQLQNDLRVEVSGDSEADRNSLLAYKALFKIIEAGKNPLASWDPVKGGSATADAVLYLREAQAVFCQNAAEILYNRLHGEGVGAALREINVLSD